MSSKRGIGSSGKVAAANESLLSKVKNVPEVSGGIGKLSQSVADMSLDSKPDAGWEIACKTRNEVETRAGAGIRAENLWVSSNPNENAWSHPDVVKKLGLRNTANTTVKLNDDAYKVDVSEDDDRNDDLDSSDNELMSDEYDSDESQKSHETRKQNKWFKAFFEILNGLTVEQINEPTRQWHCAACQGGPGAIDWYRGLQPLLTHAKTKGSKRVKPHRELAELLEEELHRRGTSAAPATEVYGQWKGLNEKAIKDNEIVWPPMVVIKNTRREKDEGTEMWLGMGGTELLEYFSSYEVDKVKHSYGPQGHRGMSVLIFEPSAVGYLEAERLSKHFEQQGIDREAWDRRRVTFLPGGKRQLYGYMAEKGDLEIFNQHSHAKYKLKFEMRSHEEVVLRRIKQMSEENQQLLWYKNKVSKEQMHSRALEESFDFLTDKLRKTEEENRIVRQRTKSYHEQNKEEMDYQEQFFKDQIKLIHDAQDEREENFEMLQQEQREKVKKYLENPSLTEDVQSRAEKYATFIKHQDKEVHEFVNEREKLLKEYEEQKATIIKRYREELIRLEEDLDAQLTWLMKGYTPHQLDEGDEGSNLF